MKPLFLFVMLSLGAKSAWALTWDQALAEARSANAGLLQAREALRQAELDELGAKTQFLPRVGVSASGSQGGDYEPQSGALTGGNSSVGLGLSGSLNLFNGFAHLAALAQARARRVQAEATLKEAQAALVYSLTQAFYQSVYGQQQIRLAEAIAARAKDNADMVELRYEAGAENKGSLLQAQALSEQYKFEAARARRQARLAALSLCRLLGRQADPGLQAQGSLSKPEALAEPDFEALLKELPALAKAQAVLDASQAAKLGAWSPFLPTLNASAGLNRSGPQWAPQNGSWNAGLSLNLNLFNGFGDSLSLRSASSGLTVSKLALEEARLQARLDLESAWSSLQDALAQVALSAGSLAATQARAEIGQAQYAQGLMSFENWDQIETQLSNSLKSELNSQLGAILGVAAWLRATGKGSEL